MIQVRRRRLTNRNKIYTPGSETTVSLNYSPVSEVLEVEFSGNKVYHYLHVKPEVWEDYQKTIRLGGSSGSFVNEQIKPNYELVRVE